MLGVNVEKVAHFKTKMHPCDCVLINGVISNVGLGVKMNKILFIEGVFKE